MLRDALDRAGYSQEEAYFHRENRRLIANLKETLSKKKNERSKRSNDRKEQRPPTGKAA